MIDGLIYSAERSVNSSTGATITIYESESPTSSTSSKDLFRLDIARLERDSVTGLNVITNQGVWINGQTDDPTTNVTLLGYYINV